MLAAELCILHNYIIIIGNPTCLTLFTQRQCLEGKKMPKLWSLGKGAGHPL
jgi:hypothetical protein